MLAIRRTAPLLIRSTVAGVGAVLVVAAPAAAHTGRGPGGVLDGILHPLTGADHLLAMLAVGVVATLATPRGRAWAVPAAFLGGMVAGGIAGLADVPLPGAEHLIVGSVLVLGVAIAAAVQGGGSWLLVALVVAGMAHGHAHGAEAPAAPAGPAAYVAAFLAVTAALHLTGMGLGLAIRQRGAVRVGIGAATVAAGALLIA